MTTALDGHITVDEQGIARVAGTRMKVIHLVMDKMAHDASPEEMQREFPHRTLARVYAALTYYHDHKAELDAQIAQAGSEADALRAQAGPQPSRTELINCLRRESAARQTC
jgi:uncharacterized protein (DUF433 family)